MQDTENEFRSELPDLMRLMQNMRPSTRERTAREGWTYGTDSLLKKIDNAMQTGQFKFRNGRAASAKDLAAFLYKINFLTARRDIGDTILRRDFEQSRYLQSQFVDFGFDWEVHPAYRWALQPQDVFSIFDTLKPTADESIQA